MTKQAASNGANVTDGSNALEGLTRLFNTCVGLLSGARGGVLLAQKEVIGFPSQVLAAHARKLPRPLQPFHQVGNYCADGFHSSRIHATQTFCRGQLATGVRAMSCWAMVPSPVHPSHFFKAVNFTRHLSASLQFVVSRKQTNSSEVFQHAGNYFHGRNR